MKNISLFIFLALFSASTLVAYTQDLYSVEELANQSKWNEAYQELLKKESKDKNNKLPNKAEYQYLKGLILYRAGIDKQKLDGLDASTDYFLTGYEYLKKAYGLNKTLVNFVVNHKGAYSQFFDIYGHYYQQGVDAFNEKKYDVAKTAYAQARTIGTFMADNEMGILKFDSNLVYLEALNFINMKDLAGASVNVEQIVRAQYKPQENLEMIKWVLFQAMENKDQALFAKFKQLGEETHPEAKKDLWDVIEDEYKLGSVSDLKDKLGVYETLIFKDKTASQRIKYNYAVEAYQYLTDKKQNPTAQQTEDLLEKIRTVSAEVFDADNNSFLTLYLYLSAYSTYIEGLNKDVSDLQQKVREKAQSVNGNVVKGSTLDKQIEALKSQIKSNKAIIAKKSIVALPNADKLIAYLEQQLPKATDKNIKSQLANVLDIAASLAYYAQLNDKGDTYDKKRESISNAK